MISNNTKKGGIYMFQNDLILEDVMRKEINKSNGKDAKLQKIAAKVIKRNYKGLKRLSKN